MEVSVCWLRRDLRLDDNSALYHALKSGYPVLPVFIIDQEIVSELKQNDKRLIFIYQTIAKLKYQFENSGSSLLVLSGSPEQIFSLLFREYSVKGVYAGVDYEPYSIARDRKVADLCNQYGIRFCGYPDHLVLAPDGVLKPDGTPYHVFTPYSKKWLQQFEYVLDQSYPSEKFLNRLITCDPFEMPSNVLQILKQNTLSYPSQNIDDQIIENYHLTRDWPSLPGTSRLGIHLRFGTISVRKLARRAYHLNRVYLNELIWREFYQMILYHYPQAVTRSFKPGFDGLKWLNRQGDIQAWYEGRTGYPLVDAGMKELTETGFMHNRLRMVTASFLTKHLLVDWRIGEAFFAQHLLDYELASNNGGWQWASGAGCDAVPYFRVFSPQRQQERFDPEETYIRRWLPGYSPEKGYLKPIIDHDFARDRAIAFLRSAQKG